LKERLVYWLEAARRKKAAVHGFTGRLWQGLHVAIK
jgi:hypothetical protein